MAVLARFLTNVVPDHRTVADRTNLAGTSDFQIDWAPEVPALSDGAPARRRPTLTRRQYSQLYGNSSA